MSRDPMQQWRSRPDKRVMPAAEPVPPADPVEAFYAAVNARAEAAMLQGRGVTGAHHRALEAEIAAYRNRSLPEAPQCPSSASSAF